MTDLELARIVEAAEVRVWVDAVRAATPAVASRLGLRVVPVAGGAAFLSTTDSTLYNRAFGFGLDETIDEATLDDMIDLYPRDRPFAIQPCPLVQPEVGGWLTRRGLVPHHDWLKWVRAGREAQPVGCDLAIETLGPDQAGIFTRLAMAIFAAEPPEIMPWVELSVGRAGWSHYIALDGDAPVAIGVLYVEGGVGWLGWGGTLASHRGRGAQSALIARRIEDARAQDCEWLTVETADDTPEKPNPSFRNVARAGFRLLYRRPSFAHLTGKKS
jgi:hypothetical protein